MKMFIALVFTIAFAAAFANPLEKYEMKEEKKDWFDLVYKMPYDYDVYNRYYPNYYYGSPAVGYPTEKFITYPYDYILKK